MIIGTLWNEDKSTQENAVSTQESSASTRKTTAERIIEEIRKHPFTTREQLAEVIGIIPDGIKKQLDKLKKLVRYVMWERQRTGIGRLLNKPSSLQYFRAKGRANDFMNCL